MRHTLSGSGLRVSPFLTESCASHTQGLGAVSCGNGVSPGSASFPEAPLCTLMVEAMVSLNRFWPHKGEEWGSRAGKGPHFWRGQPY